MARPIDPAARRGSLQPDREPAAGEGSPHIPVNAL
jgi:hypothetical protein